MKLFLSPFFFHGGVGTRKSEKLGKMLNERSLNLNHWSSTPQTLLESLLLPWNVGGFLEGSKLYLLAYVWSLEH